MVRVEHDNQVEVRDISDCEPHSASGDEQHHAPGPSGIALEVWGDEVCIETAYAPQHNLGEHLHCATCSLTCHGVSSCVRSSTGTEAGLPLKHDLVMLLTLASVADGAVLAWEGTYTSLPLGYSVLRIQTSSLLCSAKQPQEDTEHDAVLVHYAGDPVQLLCRALRLAPECYQCFELAPKYSTQPMHFKISGAVSIESEDGQDLLDGGELSLDSVAELAAAMQHFADVENLRVHMSPDEQTIIVVRVSNEVPGGAADVW